MEKFVIDQAKNGEFYFNLKAKNGEILLTSEMHKTRTKALKAIEKVRGYGQDLSRFQVQILNDKRRRFILKAPNGRRLGTSQPYKTNEGISTSIASVITAAPKAPIVDITRPTRCTFGIKQDAKLSVKI